jgi:hypothetical protein
MDSPPTTTIRVRKISDEFNTVRAATMTMIPGRMAIKLVMN